MTKSLKEVSKNVLEGIVQVARVNLFYPELKDDGDGYRPKGIAQAMIAGPIIGAIIGSQISPYPEHIAAWTFGGLLYPAISGMVGVPISYGIDQLKKKYKEKKETQKAL